VRSTEIVPSSSCLLERISRSLSCGVVHRFQPKSILEDFHVLANEMNSTDSSYLLSINCYLKSLKMRFRKRKRGIRANSNTMRMTFSLFGVWVKEMEWIPGSA
jgi:hypothetical protein